MLRSSAIRTFHVFTTIMKSSRSAGRNHCIAIRKCFYSCSLSELFSCFFSLESCNELAFHYLVVMKKWHLISFLLASLLFSGCSVNRYFILSNSTDKAISITYSLDDPTGEKAIFGVTGEVYQSNKKYYPNWERKLPYRDLNSSDDTITINLGSKSTLIFGTLLNDDYNVQTKRSTTGKVFNLKEMTFSVNGTDYLINEDNFHDFFLEDGGTYKYVIQ